MDAVHRRGGETFACRRADSRIRLKNRRKKEKKEKLVENFERFSAGML